MLLALLALEPSSSRTCASPTQQHIEEAVARALAEQPPPSVASKVYDAVKGSIVRVRASGDALENDEYLQRAVGSGVVVVDRGTILTSLHVVAGAGRIRVVFADGLESDARIVSQQPENDLAVLQADTVPDDLAAAAVRPRADLQPGEHVVAVGFPFGIGPSVTAGVVSGLKREYRSPTGERVLSDLIQFDAAVNPGSSGGPLLNASGEVVGIVTAMLDPGGGGFAGIGFAVPIETARRPPARRPSDDIPLAGAAVAAAARAGRNCALPTGLRGKKKSAVRFASLSVLKEAVGPAWRRHVPPAMLLLGLAVMLAAIARPAAVITLPSNHETVILAIDVSGSMRASDVEPSRIEAAQAAARAFVNEQPRSTRIGIVAFAGSAALVQPPSTNRREVIAAIDSLQLQHATAVGSGLLVSLKALFPDVPIEFPRGRPRRATTPCPTSSRCRLGPMPRARSSCSPTGRPPPGRTRWKRRASPPSAACASSPWAWAPRTARS